MNQHIQLRDVIDRDLSLFFTYQQDAEAEYMAAFTVKDPTNLQAFNDKWAKMRIDTDIIYKTILWQNLVVGHIGKFIYKNKPEITYWIERKYWGKGIATKALELFLKMIDIRPLYACIAMDNLGSLRVLQKCGFELVDQSKGFSNARGKEVVEVNLVLD